MLTKLYDVFWLHKVTEFTAADTNTRALIQYKEVILPV